MIKQDSPSSTTSSKRNQYSCRQCRKDKRRCSPADRDWENNFEKCDRCTSLGRECGAPEKASGISARKKEKLSLITIASKATSLSGSSEYSVSGRPPDTPLSTKSSLARSDQSSTDVDLRDATWQNMSNSIAAESQNETCMSLSDQARKTIIRLGDLNAAREMLRKEIELCSLIESWLGTPVFEKIAIHAYIVAIQREFKVETQKVMRLMMKGVEHDAEVIFSALLLIVYRFEHPIDYSGFTNICVDNQILSQLSQISSSTRSIVSDADLVCSSGLGLPVRHDPTSAAVELYSKASRVVTRIIHNAVLEDMEQRNILPRQEGVGFPPSHIAYLHGNQDAALAAWNRSDMDILGRTLLHLVAYICDIQMLYRLLEHDREVIHISKADVFGFTPLTITACCKGDQQFSCFSVLWQSGADRTVLDFKNRSVLALAARNGNAKIVSSILQDGNISRSPRHELLEAVQSDDNVMIVEMLMVYYAKHPDCIDPCILAEANRIALERGSFVIVQLLALPCAWYPEITPPEDPYAQYTMDLDESDDWELLHSTDLPLSAPTSETSWDEKITQATSDIQLEHFPSCANDAFAA